VLGRDHDLGAADRLAIDIADSDLAFGVGLQVKERTGAPLFRKHLENFVREVDRRRHERALLVDLAFGAGEAEHHALIAGALLFTILFLFGINSHRDIGRLAVQQDLDVDAVIRKPVLVVADVLDHATRDLGDQFAIHHCLAAVLVKQRRLATTFAGDDDLVRGAQRFAAKARIHRAFIGDAELDVVLDESIKNGVGDLIAHLVRVALRNGLAGEQIIGAAHGETLPSNQFGFARPCYGIARSRAACVEFVGQGCCSVALRGQDVG
jgi:hypothetical protein